MSRSDAAEAQAVRWIPLRSHFGPLKWVFSLTTALLTSAAPLPAAVPTLTAIFPNGLNPGANVPVKFTGKLDGSERRVWTDDPAISFTLPDAGGNAIATVAAEAAPGLHLVRFINAEGATLPVRFAVGPLPRVEEKEPNDETAAPQPVAKLPSWIQGCLEKAGDVDCFALTLKKGVPVSCKVDAYALGSPVDPHLHLLNQRGTKLATASDGQNLDPDMVFTPEEDGVYLLQVAGFAHPPAADVNFTGSPLCFYQVAVTEAPFFQRLFPAALPSEGKATVELLGQPLKPEGAKMELSAKKTPGYPDLGTVFPKGAPAPLSVVRAKYPIQSFPEASSEKPVQCSAPCVTGGRIVAPGASAAYRISMKKGDRLQARFWSRSIGLGLDGNLSVNSPAGEEVVTNPNPADPFQEPTVVWTATLDGDYTLVVRDLFRRGGPGAEFVLEIAAPAPSYTLELLDGKPVRLETGKTLVLKARATFLNGWKEPLVLRFAGLPEGVFAPEIAVPEKGGEFDIPLQAASNAPAATAAAWASVWTKATPPVAMGVAYPLRGEMRRGLSQSDFARDLWVTVGPPLAAPAAPPTKK